MITTVLAILLLLVVLSAWLGAAGFLRLRTVSDRLHCAAFVNVACGLPLVACGFIADGASDRALKIALVVGLGLVTGAVTSHTLGRALLMRGDLEDARRAADVPEPIDPRPVDERLG